MGFAYANQGQLTRCRISANSRKLAKTGIYKEHRIPLVQVTQA